MVVRRLPVGGSLPGYQSQFSHNNLAHENLYVFLGYSLFARKVLTKELMIIFTSFQEGNHILSRFCNNHFHVFIHSGIGDHYHHDIELSMRIGCLQGEGEKRLAWLSGIGTSAHTCQSTVDAELNH